MTLSRFARLLGLPAHQAEDALHSERAARAVLSRRSFFAASGAMAAGSCFSFAGPAAAEPIISGAVYSWADIEITLGGFPLRDVVSISFEPPVGNVDIRHRAVARVFGSVVYESSFDVDPRDLPPEIWNSL